MKNMRISYFHTLLNSSTIYLKNGFFLFCMWVGGYIFPFFYSFLLYVSGGYIFFSLFLLLFLLFVCGCLTMLNI
ncbi:hypothetical protein GLOIN_2v1625188 [Rhizophagus irregularis DAOM 181602=DAOM 197198]|nr:hypothetical protein GLOIN_2v1625188 [Rhizophagus irregularis DAOM 181602=DAOM 197198]